MRIVLEKYNKWFALAAALLIVALIAAAVRPYSPPATITQAEPPAEREITFDMEQNRAYTAADGIVVIPASDPTPPDAELLTTGPSQTEPSQTEPLRGNFKSPRSGSFTVNCQLSTVN